jgi:hypothetical protein
MKKISIVIFAALFAISCNEKKEGPSATNDLFLDNLKGAVQQTMETPYQTDSTGKIGVMDSCCISLGNYDSAGNFNKYVSKDGKGNIKFEQSISRYDNSLFKEITNSANSKQSGRITIQLDKEGKKYATAIEYDSSGKLSSFYKDITQNEYNQLTSMKQYKPDSTLKQSEETKYDKQIFVEQTTKDSSGKEISKTSAKVDDKGNQIESTRTSTMKDAKTKKDSTTTKITKYKYDSFDDKGNWTQRTEMDEKGKPTKIVKREITYYKK